MAEDKLPPARNILIMSGLTGVSTVILAGLLFLGSCDLLWKTCGVPTTLSILAFAVGLPLMAISILYAYTWLGSTKKVASVWGNILRGIGYLCVSLGILFTFFRFTIWAGGLFLGSSVISLFSYMLYRVRVNRANSPTGKTEKHNHSEPPVR